MIVWCKYTIVLFPRIGIKYQTVSDIINKYNTLKHYIAGSDI